MDNTPSSSGTIKASCRLRSGVPPAPVTHSRACQLNFSASAQESMNISAGVKQTEHAPYTSLKYSSADVNTSLITLKISCRCVRDGREVGGRDEPTRCFVYHLQYVNGFWSLLAWSARTCCADRMVPSCWPSTEFKANIWKDRD